MAYWSCGQQQKGRDLSDELPTLQECFDAQVAYDLQRQLNGVNNTSEFNLGNDTSDNLQFSSISINDNTDIDSDDIEENNPYAPTEHHRSDHVRADAELANQLQLEMCVEPINQTGQFAPSYQHRRNSTGNPFISQFPPSNQQRSTFRPRNSLGAQHFLERGPILQQHSSAGNAFISQFPQSNRQRSTFRPRNTLRALHFPERGPLEQQHNSAGNAFNGFLMHASVEVQDDLSYEQMLELEDEIGDVAANRLEERDIQRLPKFRYSVDRRSNLDNGKCSICWEDFTTDKMARKLNCGHIFDVECIDTWLKKKAECPVCRQEIKVDK